MNDDLGYEISDLTGISKIYYQVYNTKNKSYEGSRMYAYPFRFFKISYAKKFIKERKLENYEIHKIEDIIISKKPVIMKI